MTAPVATKYEVVIGIEVHAQVDTRSKMFCACATPPSDAQPNTHVCPVCLGMPGVLPVINQQAVELTVMTGLALNCTIPEHAKFDRKNYPYPDIMKGYQISQYDLPLCKDGWLDIEIEVDGERPETKRVRINRVHLEEDVARLRHRTNEAGEAYSLVDVNRAGLPLMEIVSEPDIRSAEEARAYLVKLRQVLRYVGSSRANMEEGNMRCEPNVSLRPVGHPELGSKVELKNINSFRAVYLAIQYEVERQREVLDSGGRIEQETRGWREDLGQTVAQRSKEFAHDYRYFPEPDLPPLNLDRDYVEGLRARLPELSDARLQRFMAEYGLGRYEANLLTESRARADYFEAAVGPAKHDGATLPGRSKAVANWMLGDFARLLNIEGLDISEAQVAPNDLHAMIDLIESGTISGAAAKSVFEEMFATGKAPGAIVQERGLTQISAAGELSEVIEKVIAANEKPAADYRAGKEEALKFLVGQVMKETRGRANPGLVPELLRQRLGTD